MLIPWAALGVYSMIEWMCLNGLIVVWCILLSLYSWSASMFWFLFAFWEWWIIYASGLWNATDTRSLCTIFIVNPSWAFEKPPSMQHPIDCQYYLDLQDCLNKIYIIQAQSSAQLHHQLHSPWIVASCLSFIWALCCAINLLEVI